MTAVKTDEMKVKLTFDNRQFEQGVRQSSDSISRLKASLDLSQQTNSLNAFKNAASSIGTPFSSLKGGVANVNNFGNAIDQLTNKTNILHKAFDNVGFWLKKNLVDDTYRKLKGIFTAIPNQIISGGKRRAQNIEQAKFQLKGLLKDKYDWDKINADIDYAVSGTRYGLDAAAKVAAQLSASNISFGDEMKSALRGISGVAAMTNSEYEDIGHIFTTIAGQGKLMTQQLNQFAGRGLNVAATLAEHYKVTEAQLREMVTKGKVDFKTFATVMNEAFGEQATKANDTFSGVLSNVKASLSRMGAQFATPAYEELRKTLVMLLPVLKDVEKFLKPVSARFEELAKVASTVASDQLRNLHFDFLDMLGIKGTSYASQVSQVTDILDELRKKGDKALKVTSSSTSEGTEETIKALKTANDLYQAAIDMHKAVEDSAKKRIESGEDEATVLKEQQMAYQTIGGLLADYEKEIHGTVEAEKQLTEETKKANDAASKKSATDNSVRNKALALYSAEMQETDAVNKNTTARKKAIEAATESTKAMAEAGETAANNIFGLNSGAFDTSVKRVTDYLEGVSKESEKAFEFGGLSELVDPAKKLADETAIQQGLYVELEKAVADINKTAEQQIKLGRDETVVNKEKEAALKRLKDIAESYDKQSIFSLDLLDKESKGRKATTQLYENAKKTVDGLKSGFLKLLGAEQEEGKQVQQNAGEYKGLEELAWDVIRGKYGNGEERKKALEDLGLSYAIIQNKVNELLGCEKRHEVTAEDEAKMAKYLGTSLEEAGKSAEKQKTTYQKLIDVLAGIGAAISIIRKAATAVINNIVKPFLGWALPKVFDAILTILDPIALKLIELNEIWTDEFFDTKTKDIVNWFINAKDAVVEFWGKAKELDGIKKLQEAFEKFKQVLGEIGSSIFGKITDGFKGLGQQGQTIFTMENILNVLDLIATKASDFFNFVWDHRQNITTAIDTIYRFLVMLKDGIVSFFKDPMASIKGFGAFVKSNLGNIKERIGEFLKGLSADPKAVLQKLFSNIAKGFQSFKNNIIGFFKNLFPKDPLNLDGVVDKAFDAAAMPATLLDKAKALILSFANGIKDFLSENGIGGSIFGTVKDFITNLIGKFDIKKGLVIAGTGGFIYIVARIIKAIVGLIKLLGSFAASPVKFIQTLSNLGNTLGDYSSNLKADTLLKIAVAIGVFAVAIAALSFLNTDNILKVSIALGIILGMMSLFAFSVSKIVKAAAEGKKAKTALGEFMNSFQFKTGIVLSSAAMLIASIALLVGVLTLCVKALLKVDWAREGIPAALALTGFVMLLVGAIVAINKLTDQSGGKFGGSEEGSGGILKIAASMMLLSVALAALVVPIAILSVLPIMMMLRGLLALGLALTGLTVAVIALNKFGDGGAEGAKSLTKLALALALLVPAILLLGAFGDTSFAGLAAMGTALLVLVVAAVALSKIDTDSFESFANGILKMSIAALILGPALILLANAIVAIGQLWNAYWPEMLAGLIVIAGALTALSLLGKFLGPGLMAIAAPIGILAAAVLGLALVTGLLPGIKNNVIKTIGPIATVLKTVIGGLGGVKDGFKGFSSEAVNYTTAIDSYSKSLEKMSFLSEEAKGNLLSMVSEIKTLDGSAYSVAVENLRSYIDGLNITEDEKKRVLRETFEHMVIDANEEFTIAVVNLKVALANSEVPLTKEEEKEFWDAIESMADLNPGDAIMHVENIHAIIDNAVVDDEVSKANIKKAVNEVISAGADYSASIKGLKIWLIKNGMTVEGVEKVISTVKEAVNNESFETTLSSITALINENTNVTPAGLADLQAKVESALATGRSFTAQIGTLKAKAEATLDPQVYTDFQTELDNIKNAFQAGDVQGAYAALGTVIGTIQHSKIDPEDKKELIDKVHNVFGEGKEYLAKVASLKIGLKESGYSRSALIRFSHLWDELEKSDAYNTATIEQLWVECTAAGMTDAEIEQTFNEIEASLAAGAKRTIMLSNLGLALQNNGVEDEEVRNQIIEEMKGIFDNESGALVVDARDKAIQILLDHNPEMTYDTASGMVDEYIMEAGDAVTAKFNMLKVLVDTVEFASNAEKNHFKGIVDNLMTMDGYDLQMGIDQFIIDLSQSSLDTSDYNLITAAAEELKNIYTTSYEELYAEKLRYEEALRRSEFTGAFVADMENGKGYINAQSKVAKEMQSFFKDMEEVTDADIAAFAAHMREKGYSMEDIIASFSGTGMTDEELAHKLFPYGEALGLSEAEFTAFIGPFARSLVSGTYEEVEKEVSKYGKLDWAALFNQLTGGANDTIEVVSPIDGSKITYTVDELMSEFDWVKSSIVDYTKTWKEGFTGVEPLTFEDIYKFFVDVKSGSVEGMDEDSLFQLSRPFSMIFTEIQNAIDSGLITVEEAAQLVDATLWKTFDFGSTVDEKADAELEKALAGLDGVQKELVDKLKTVFDPEGQLSDFDFYKKLTGIFKLPGLSNIKFDELTGASLDEITNNLMSEISSSLSSGELDYSALADLFVEFPEFQEFFTKWIEDSDIEVPDDYEENISEALEAATERAVKEAKVTETIDTVVQNEVSGEGQTDLLGSLQEQLVNGELDTDQVASKLAANTDFASLANGLVGEGSPLPGALTDALGGSLTSVVADGVAKYLAEGGDISGGLSGIIESITGTLFSDSSTASVATAAGQMAKGAGNAYGIGYGDGIEEEKDYVNGKVSVMANSSVDQLKTDIDSASPSKVTKEIGGYFAEGYADGISSMMSLARVGKAVVALASASITPLAKFLDKFKTAGVSAALQYAFGISNTTTNATTAGESVGQAAENGARNELDDAYTAGEDWGKGYVKGLESQIDEARAAGRKLSAAGESGNKEKGEIASPSKVAKRLGNFWGMGYVIGLNEYVKKAGRAGQDLGNATIHALETPMRIIQDIIDSDVDASPVITPVLDLSNIQNGARRINGLLPVGAMDLGAISYSMANRHETTNADVVAAILGLSGSMEGSRGDTYNINGVTYDDGSNIIDAVQTLVRAARVERRR